MLKTNVIPLTITEWRQASQQGMTLADALHAVAARLTPDDAAWILCLGLDAWLAQASALQQRLADADGDLGRFPLFGVPCQAPVDAHQQFMAAVLAGPGTGKTVVALHRAVR